MASGWKILSKQLSLRNKQLLITAILLYSGFKLSYDMCDYPQNLCAVYELFFNVIKFLITFAGVVSLNSSAEGLRHEFHPQHPHRLMIARKMLFLRNFRLVLIPLMGVPLIIVFMNFTILSWREAWIYPVVQGCLFLFTMWYCKSNWMRLYTNSPSKQYPFLFAPKLKGKITSSWPFILLMI